MAKEVQTALVRASTVFISFLAAMCVTSKENKNQLN